jgi:type VI secretion system secreted protein VgrG
MQQRASFVHEYLHDFGNFAFPRPCPRIARFVGPSPKPRCRHCQTTVVLRFAHKSRYHAAMLMPRPQFTLTSPLGEDLRFHAMTHVDELSKLGSTQLTLLSPRADLAPEDLLGQALTVTARLRDGQRFFHGHVTRFGLVGHEGRHFKYEARLCPWPWFLTRTSDCRIFQDQSVPAIVKTVFQDHVGADFEFRLSRPYRSRTYCVQYRETDFAFVARLLADEGIYWHVRHAQGRHTLVLQDIHSTHGPAAGCEALPYIADPKAAPPDTECISAWDFSRGVRPGRFELASYDFERPRADLRADRSELRDHDLAGHERFDFQGDYTQADDGRDLVEIRLEEEQARHERLSGCSNAHGLAVGHLFGLQRHPRADQNRQYLCVSTTIKVEPEGAEATHQAGKGPGGFSCKFTALPANRQFRPPFGGKPSMRGPQSAVVTGPRGEEIHTDKYGRVKVQFHWDRHGRKDEKSSCWIRVSHPWAGKGWGAVSIPRIGQEVIVDFLEGDPDQPIITGRVYNAEAMPPFALPGQAVVSGLKSKTHKGQGFNEMSMNDTAGQEKITVHAQYDMGTTVLHDQTLEVKNNRTDHIVVNDTLTVDANRSVHVKGKLAETVDTGQETTITAGYTETISGGATSTIHGGLTSTVNQQWDHTVNGPFTETVTGPIKQTGQATLDMHAQGAGTYTSDTSLKFAVGGSTIEITKDAITLTLGPSVVKLDPAGVAVNGVKIALNG